jgi:phage-related protein
MEVRFFDAIVEKSVVSLDWQSRLKVARMIALLEEVGNKIGMPYSKSLGRGLFELRVTGNQNVRLLYCYFCNEAAILHGFVKKTFALPGKELKLALQRKSCLDGLIT